MYQLAQCRLSQTDASVKNYFQFTKLYCCPISNVISDVLDKKSKKILRVAAHDPQNRHAANTAVASTMMRHAGMINEDNSK